MPHTDVLKRKAWENDLKNISRSGNQVTLNYNDGSKRVLTADLESEAQTLEEKMRYGTNMPEVNLNFTFKHETY